MRSRNKKSMLIGMLCCALVFMGVGFAVLNQNLNINTTGNISGKWDIYIESIGKSDADSTSGAVSVSANVDSPTKASFTAQLKEPGDKIVYDVKVVNNGNINAILKTVIVNQTADTTLQTYLDNNSKKLSDYFNVENTLQANTNLDAGSDTTFQVSVEFNKAATDLPEGNLNVEIILLYVQEGSYIPSGDGTNTNELDFTVDENGTITGYNAEKVTNSEGYVVVPAVNEEGEAITGVDLGSFAEYNIAQFYDYNEETEEETYGIVIYDEENYDAIKSVIETMMQEQSSSFVNKDITPTKLLNNIKTKNNMIKLSGSGSGSDSSEESIPIYKASELESLGLSENTEFYYMYYDIETGELMEYASRIEKIDLSQASNLTTIGDYTFAYSPLTSIIFGENSKITTIEESAFADANLSGELILPSTLATIGASAFSGNQISKLTIPSGVTSIGEAAFEYNQISEITFEDGIKLETIGESAFQGNQISELTIPSSVTTIGSSAFSDNQLSGELVIPASVVTIGNSAFGGWSFTNKISKLTFERGSKLETIGGGAFRDNQLSGELVIPASVTTIEYWAFRGSDDGSTNKISSLTFESGSKLETMGDYAFESNQISGELVIPSSVTTIGKYAFAGSRDGSTNRISSLTFENGSKLETIGDYAFFRNQLTGELIIPASVTTIGNSAFEGESDGSTNKISGLTFESGSKLETIGGSAFEQNQISGELVIHASVTTIGRDAFSSNQISKLTIPSGVTIIGYSAFEHNQISVITFERGSKLETIGGGAFRDNQLSGELVIPASVTTIEYWAFRGSDDGSTNKISSLTFESGSKLETMGDYAFRSNKLTSVTLGGSVLTSIGEDAFYNGSGTLKTINVNMTEEAFASVTKGTSWYGGTPTFNYLSE